MKHNTAIHNALLKYGYSNFTLDILEYCVGTNPVLREQFYFDTLKPEYNILQQAGSSLGFKHREETLDYFKNNREVSEETRKNLSLAATGRILTVEDKDKISNSRQGIKLSDETRAKISATTTSLIGVSVIVINVNTLEEVEYASLTEAGRAIGVSRTAVKKAIVSEKLIQKLYCCIAVTNQKINK